MMTRYKGKIYGWDVVNEAMAEDGVGLKPTIWSNHLGPNFIPEAFHLARKMDPSTKLYINDYWVEGINAKSTGFLNYVKKLRSEGVPIDGVGFQCHFKSGAVPPTLEENLKRFADIGVEVAITEFDVGIDVPPDAAKLEQQAKDFAQVFQICQNIPKCVGVTHWSWTDRYSWLRDTQPCMWDNDFQPKPAVAAVQAVLKGK